MILFMFYLNSLIYFFIKLPTTLVEEGNRWMMIEGTVIVEWRPDTSSYLLHGDL